MSNKININNTLKPFNKTLEIEGDKVYQLGGLY